MQSKLVVVPCALKDAFAFVAKHHRHHRAPSFGLFALACAPLVGAELGAIVGVSIVGRPVARLANDGWTAEIVRVAVAPSPEDESKGYPNACSFLYAASWRAARALGYQKLITYTLKEESGVALRAAGWSVVGESSGGSWHRKNRPRVDTHPLQAKLRWEVSCNTI